MNLFGDDDVIYDDDERHEDDGWGAVSADLSADIENEEYTEKTNPHCLGHAEQERQFLELFSKNAIPHAMIFSGIQGIGKTTMAFRFARFLLKHGKPDEEQDALFGVAEIATTPSALDVASDDPVFRRIAAGAHADLLHICRETDSTGKVSSSLKVDALRKIEPFLRKTSSEGGWRIVLVEDADTMNNAAQNAILKILEEPPKNVLIILIAHRIGKLIPTIRSRTRLVQFYPLSGDNLQNLLGKKAGMMSAKQREIIALISEGSIGQAIKFIENEGVEVFERILDIMAKMPHYDWKAVHEFCASLSAPAQDKSYQQFCEVFQWIFRRMLFTKARGEQNLPECLQHEALAHFYNNTSLHKLSSLCDDLATHFNRTEYANLDRRDAVRAGFLMISQ